MNRAPSFSSEEIDSFQRDYHQTFEVLKKVVLGQEHLVAQMLVGLLAGGHLLLEGLPGLGKTHLAKAVANALDVQLSRVQCTPDLMPADITGSEILVEGDSGKARHLEFCPGPIFSSMVLVDEINRATPKTQSALLEAMQENQVTYAGKHHPLPALFRLIATQNPIEFEGTYPLPEAQLDRFIFKLQVAYPDRNALLGMLNSSLDSEPCDAVRPTISAARAREMLCLSQTVVMPPTVREAATDLVLATHPEHALGKTVAKTHFAYGASPRALQALVRTARIRALSRGRPHLAKEDLAYCALPVLRHRVRLRIESELDRLNIDDLLGEVIAEWTNA